MPHYKSSSSHAYRVQPNEAEAKVTGETKAEPAPPQRVATSSFFTPIPATPDLDPSLPANELSEESIQEIVSAYKKKLLWNKHNSYTSINKLSNQQLNLLAQELDILHIQYKIYPNAVIYVAFSQWKENYLKYLQEIHTSLHCLPDPLIDLSIQYQSSSLLNCALEKAYLEVQEEINVITRELLSIIKEKEDEIQNKLSSNKVLTNIKVIEESDGYSITSATNAMKKASKILQQNNPSCECTLEISEMMKIGTRVLCLNIIKKGRSKDKFVVTSDDQLEVSHTDSFAP